MKYFVTVVFNLLDTNKVQLFKLLALFLFVALLDLLSIGLVGPFILLISEPDKLSNYSFWNDINQILQFESYSTGLVFIGVCLCFIFVIKAVASYISQRKITLFAFKQQSIMMKRLIQDFQYIKYEAYLLTKSSELINNVNNLTNVFTHQVLLSTLRLVSEGVIVIAILTLLFMTNMIAMIVLMFLLLFIYIVYSYKVKDKLKLAGENIIKQQDKIIKDILLIYDGFKEIRVYGREDYTLKEFRRSLDSLASSNTEYRSLQIIPKLMIESILMIFIVAIALTTIIFEYSTIDMLATLSIFGVASIRIVPSANVIMSSTNDLKYASNAIKSLDEQFNSMRKNRYMDISQGNSLDTLSGDIIVENLKYKYNKALNENVINDINLVIKKGSMTGIIGKSGSGKTTFVDLIIGFLDSNNSICIGKSPMKKNIRSWLNNVAYIPQNIFIMDATIAENITLSKNCMDEDRLNLAIDMAQLRGFIQSSALGLQTKTGERGNLLSGGQRQRLGIARAFYFNKECIVMDEVTSALDGDTEKEIVKVIGKLKGEVTMIMITHRHDTLKNCDSIIKFKNGKIDRI
jgi:ATP-binding cassette, subfamily B, bacterial PglK